MKTKIMAGAVLFAMTVSMLSLFMTPPPLQKKDLTASESDIQGGVSGTFFFNSGYNFSSWIDTENITTNVSTGIRIMGGSTRNETATIENGSGITEPEYAYLFNGTGGNGSVAFSFTVPDYVENFKLYKMALNIGRLGTPDGDLIISIRNSTSDLKPNIELSRVILNTSDVPESAGGSWIWVNVTETGIPLELSNGTYFVVLYSNSTNMNSSITYYVKLAPDPDNPSGAGAYSEDKSITYFLNYTSLADINNPSNWNGDDIYDVYFMYNGTEIPRNQSCAVRFEIASPQYIDLVSLYLGRNGSTDAILSVSIRNGSDVPGNGTFAVANISAGDIPAGGYGWVKVDFNDTMLPVGTYFITINITSGATKDAVIKWRANFDPGVSQDLDGAPVPPGANDTENRTIVRIYRGGVSNYFNDTAWGEYDDIYDVWSRVFLNKEVSGAGRVSVSNYTKTLEIETGETPHEYVSIYNYSGAHKFYAVKISISGSITTLNSFQIFATRNGTPPIDAYLIVELRNATNNKPSSTVLARWNIPPAAISPLGGSWLTVDSTYEENSSSEIYLESGDYFLVFFTNGTYDSANTISLAATPDTGTYSDQADEEYVISSPDMDAWNVSEAIDIWLGLTITRPVGLIDVTLPDGWNASSAYLYIFDKAIITPWWFNGSFNVSSGLKVSVPPQFRTMDLYWNASYNFTFVNTSITDMIMNVNPDSPAIPGIDLAYSLISSKVAQKFSSDNIYDDVNLTVEFMTRQIGSPGALRISIVEELSGWPFGKTIATTTVAPTSENWTAINVTFPHVSLEIWNYYIVIEPVSANENNYYQLGFSQYYGKVPALVYNGSTWDSYLAGGLSAKVFYSGNISYDYLRVKIGTWALDNNSLDVYTISRVYGGSLSVATSGPDLHGNFTGHASLSYLSPLSGVTIVRVNDVDGNKLPNNGFHVSLDKDRLNQTGNNLHFEVELKNSSWFRQNISFGYMIVVDAVFNMNATALLKNDTIVACWFNFTGNVTVPAVLFDPAFTMSLNESTSNVLEVKINDTTLRLNQYSLGNNLQISRVAFRAILGTSILSQDTYFTVNITLVPKFDISADERAFFNESYMLNVTSLAYRSNITSLYLVLISPTGQFYNMSFTVVDPYENWTITTFQLNETGDWRLSIYAPLLGREIAIYDRTLTVFHLGGYIELPDVIYANQDFKISVITYYAPTDKNVRPGAWDHANVTLYIDGTPFNLTDSNNGIFEFTYAPSKGTHDVWAVIITDHGYYETEKVTFTATTPPTNPPDYTWVYIVVGVLVAVAAVAGIYHHVKRREK